MKRILLFLVAYLLIVNAGLFAQQDCEATITHSLHEFDEDGETQYVTIRFFQDGYEVSECDNFQTVEFFNVPSWVSIVDLGDQWSITCEENTTPESRSAFIYFEGLNTQDDEGIEIRQGVGCYQYYYLDTDGDGFGDFNDTTPESSCTPVSGRVPNNLDYCIEDPYSTNNGCEPGYVYENKNWTQSEAYDIDGNLKAKSKSYFDDLGKADQTQTVDIKTDKTWQTQTLYDAQGRPALQTLSAPINENGTFLYNSGFIKNSSGGNYGSTDFETNGEKP